MTTKTGGLADVARRGTDHMEEAGTPSPAGWLPGDSVAVSHSNLPIASSYLDGGPIQRVAGRANRSTGEPAVIDGAQSFEMIVHGSFAPQHTWPRGRGTGGRILTWVAPRSLQARPRRADRLRPAGPDSRCQSGTTLLFGPARLPASRTAGSAPQTQLPYRSETGRRRVVRRAPWPGRSRHR